MSQFNTTELDFEKIKNNLIGYFKRQDGPFKDYDFTGSGLDNLLDILAYNTHYNAVNAHMAMNESFLDSAQVRGNVVSRAKLLGYTPKSVTAPSASISLQLDRKSTKTGENSLKLPIGTQFITSIDEATYVFETEEDYYAQIDQSTGTFNFPNVTIKQGSTRIEDYTIDNSYDQRFVINSQKVDTKSLRVKVYDTIAAIESSAETYSLFTEFPNVDGTSKIYFLDENADGNFEIRFGNNLFGKKPQASGLVRLTYLVSDGAIANGASTFTFKDGQTGLDIVAPGTAIVTTLSKAAGGAASENIDSIKYNAPLSFIAQERAVTSDDYKSLIMKNFTGIDNVVSWGGETEVPAQMGKIYISVKPTATNFLTDLQKTNILSLLSTKKVVGITPVIVDPEYTYIYYELFFKYDPSATTFSAGALAATVKQALINYNATKLNNFDGVYRHSNLLSAIDNSDPAILNTTARVYCYKNMLATASSLDSHQVDFGFEIDQSGDPTANLLETSSITIGGVRNYLEDQIITGDITKRRIVSFKVDDAGNKVVTNTNIGFLYPSTGIVDLPGLKNDISENIQIKVRPASDDIISSKRKILQIDINSSSIVGDVDNISIAGSAGLSKYNTINRD
jgi:hypothetical protein